MKRFIYLKTVTLLSLVFPLLVSCEKNEGKIYLKVIDSINTESQIAVNDSKNEIPVDGNYHEVSGYLEAKYKLLNVPYDSVTNWTPACVIEQVTMVKRSLNHYFGDFEKFPDDSYYTLILEYKREQTEPAINKYLKSGFNLDIIEVIFSYSDNSSLSYSPAP